jgi:hypothetical protein
LSDTGLELLDALGGLEGLLAQVRGLACLREVQEHQDRETDHRGEPDIRAHRRDQLVDR